MFPLEEIVKSKALGPNVRRTGRQWLGLRAGPQGRYVAVYPNGKVLVAGCRTLDEASGVLDEVAARLSPYTDGQKVCSDPLIQNIVATSDLGRTLDLGVASKALTGSDIEYEPEQFPGLVLRLEDPRAVVLFFVSGKFVVTGTKSFSDLEKAVNTAVNLMGDAGL